MGKKAKTADTIVGEEIAIECTEAVDTKIVSEASGHPPSLWHGCQVDPQHWL